MTAPKCAECDGTPKLTTGAVIYPHRPDLSRKPMWACKCGAYVGCHPGTTVALGSCAGEALRKARLIVHDKLDPWWRRHGVSRSLVYQALAAGMKIPSTECHVAMFGIDRCRAAWRVLTSAGFAAEMAPHVGTSPRKLKQGGRRERR